MEKFEQNSKSKRMIRLNNNELKYSQTQMHNMNKLDDKLMFGSTKYLRLIEESYKIKEKLKLNLVCDKTLFEHIHKQMKFSLTTNDNLKDIFQINPNIKNNDTRELFYNKSFTITPLLYSTLIHMCAPTQIECLNLNYLNEKAIVFDYTNIIEKKVFEEEYIKPFFYSEVLPQLENEFEEISQSDPVIIKSIDKQNWLHEFIKKLYDNIIIIRYTNLIELSLKVQNIPNIIKIIKNVCLIVIDSPNLLISQEIKLDHYEENLNEIKDIRRSSHPQGHNIKNKRKSNKFQHNFFDTIYKNLKCFQKEFNFNLILTLYEYQRNEELNYLKYKFNDSYFNIEDHSTFICIKIGEEGRIQFIFQPIQFQDKHKIYSFEPHHLYYDLDCNIFGYLISLDDGKFKFCAYMKKKDVNEIQLLKEFEFLYEFKKHI